ncbi:PadR family transcriptional regulator [Actinocorallia aurantiaca]|uniref:Transcription regulator PadR N-terminal domain-containing protein n=1 Tax=Actinocorallia aurantiaca TaxID=46204 RepID=A0ABN3UBE1_9ACTN
MRGRHGGWHGPGPESLFGLGERRGRGPWAGPGGPPFGGPPRKARRGGVRAAILLLLSEEPRNGYQIIQEAEERSGGAWKPSPGAVYPALQQLTDEGLIRGEESEGRKTFTLTDEGRAHVEANPPEAPWAEHADPQEWPGDVKAVFKEAAQLGTALIQVVQAGTPSQITEARKLIGDTRRRLYGILADETDEPDENEE